MCVCFSLNTPLCLYLPFLSLSSSVFPYRKGAPPPLPPRMSKSSLSVRAQSSTESTQDAYFQNSGQLVSSSGSGGPKQHSNSVDMGSSDGPSGRSSRGGYYTGAVPGRSRQHSNSAESLDGVRSSRELVPYGGGPGVGVRAKHSSSADSLLEGPPRPTREREGRMGGSLGKSASLPQNSLVLSKTSGQDEGRVGRKWSPSIAVQVRKERRFLCLNSLCSIRSLMFLQTSKSTLCSWIHTSSNYAELDLMSFWTSMKVKKTFCPWTLLTMDHISAVVQSLTDKLQRNKINIWLLFAWHKLSEH